MHQTGQTTDPPIPDTMVPVVAPGAPMLEDIELSLILPAYNEAPNLAVLIPEVVAVLDDVAPAHEILIVDDGSTDGTRGIAAELRERYPRVQYIRLRRNYGKSTALQTGFDRARGAYVVLMDADGQDRPEEIPRLLAALHDGLDLVTGRREERDDRWIKRTTSKIYNAVTKKVTGVPGDDFNSGLKAMRRSVITPVVLYGELHRYIPVLAHWAGFRVGEVPVEHRARLHGTTKFGRTRFWRGFLDLFTVKFITTYTGRPFHLFGGVGLLFGTVGAGLLLWMFIDRLLGMTVGNRPALLAGILFAVVGVQLMSLGLIAELIVHLRGERDSARFVDDD